MIVSRLNLTDFRNYSFADTELRAGSNLFVGSNGQGKTNLVESLVFLSTLGSHRVSSDQAMIRQGADSAIIRAQLRHGEQQLLLEVQLNRVGPNRAKLNRSQIKVRELPRFVSTVLFAPEDLALVRGEPAGRRRFLDQLLVLRSPRFSGVISDYERVLKQRNSLLKSARSVGLRGRASGDSGAKSDRLRTLDIWDERLVALGSELTQARLTLVADLRPETAAAYRAVAGADHHPTLSSEVSSLADDPTAGPAEPVIEPLGLEEIAQNFRSSLARLRREELDRGVTLVGPHRDDLVLGLNGMPARGYASHGESWSFALSLKLASAAVLRNESNTGDPILILDDVFAELDESRRARLADAVTSFEQVLITAAVLADVPAELAGHTVRIERGTIVETGDQQDEDDDVSPVEEKIDG